MSDLNEQIQTVTRKQWDRTRQVRVISEYGKAPKMIFEIETATTENGEFKGAVPKSLLTLEFDPTAEYPLINPEDNSEIAPSGGSHVALHVQLYSLFRNHVKW